MFALNQGRFRPPSLLATGAIMLVLVAIIVVESNQYSALKKVADQYHSAPGCGNSGGMVNSALPPCTVEAYTVVRPYTNVSVTNSGRHTHVHTRYMLDIQSPSGDRRSVELENTVLWAILKPGDSIKVQLWQGKSRLVYANGRAAPTSNNPDYRAGQVGQVVLLVGIIGLVAAGFLAYGIFARGKSISVSSPRSLDGFMPGQAAAPTTGYFTQGPNLAGAHPAIGAIADKGAVSVAGQWHGSWSGSSGGQVVGFDARLEVANSGIIKGAMEDTRGAQSTIAGEQEGAAFRFVKRSARQGPTEVFEFRGQSAPDGLTIGGSWHRTGRVLGIPFRTAGTWTASRVAPAASETPAVSQSGEL